MKGKDKCKILKEIRAQIAEANGIEWVTENCTHKGECRGTCPKCESEVAALERALARRRALGKTVAVAGISAGIVVSTAMTSSCALIDAEVAGDMVAESARTTAASTVSLPGEVTEIGIQGAMTEIGPDGDMVISPYYTDFTLTEARRFEVKIETYAYGVITEEDALFVEGTTLPVGAIVELVGEIPMGGESLIRYEGKYYYLYSGELEEIAIEVTEAPVTTAAPETTD